ncbi:MAG TPA: hypothetical protein VKG92_07140 [Flavobacteriales bacterium]|nr:hypothetical protein [Flavobacteriales bacterium]
MRQRHRSILLNVRAVTSTVVLMGTVVQAQPPWVVDWFHDQVLWHPIGIPNQIKIDPNTDRTLVMIKDPDLFWYPDCSGSGWIRHSLDSTGIFIEPCCSWCLTVPGDDQYCGTICPLNGPVVSLFTEFGGPTNYVYAAVFGQEPVSIGCGNSSNLDWNSGHPPSAGDGSSLFIGGVDNLCSSRVWKTTYPYVSAYTDWCPCIPHAFESLDQYGDTLLAVGLPSVTKVVKANAELAGTFEVFSGAALGNGWSCTSGDTLFWTGQFGGGDLHVGKYVINSGPLWEVSLPYTGDPVELHDDGLGRLWTAVGNTIIWLDQSDGSYNTYPFALSVDAMDMYNGSIVITGDAGGGTSYIMRAHIIP